MSNIVLLVGKSGTGKTTVADIATRDYGKTQVFSHTTRPPRCEGETGHVFVDRKGFDEIRSDLVAYTFFNGYEYGATAETVDASDIYVIDPDGVRTFLDTYRGEKTPVAVVLEADEKTCLLRMIGRGDSVEDAARRAMHDKAAFSDTNFSCQTVRIDVSRIRPDVIAESIVRMFLMDETIDPGDLTSGSIRLLREMALQLYPPGTRIRVGHMDDPHTPVPDGTIATVEKIDGIGQLHCSYEGVQSSLALIPGVDIIEKA